MTERAFKVQMAPRCVLLLLLAISVQSARRAVAVRVVETGEVRLADSISRARAAPVHEAVILQLLGDVVKHAETVQSQVYADTQWLRDAGSPEDVSLGYALSMDKMLDAAENLDRATLLAVSAQQAADAKAEAEAAFAHASSVTETVEAQTATHREARAAAGANSKAAAEAQAAAEASKVAEETKVAVALTAAQEKAAKEKAAKEKAAQEKAAQEEAAQEKAAQEKAAAEAQKAAAEAAEQAAAARQAEAERLEKQRLAAERLKVERIEAEQRRQQQQLAAQLAAQLAVAAGGAAATTTVVSADPAREDLSGQAAGEAMMGVAMAMAMMAMAMAIAARRQRGGNAASAALTNAASAALTEPSEAAAGESASMAAATVEAEMALKTALKKTKRKKKKATGGATQTLWAPPAYPLDWAPATPSSVPAESTSSALPLPVACQVMPPLSPGWVMAAKPKGRRSIKSRGEAEGGSPPTASSRTLHAPPSLEALLQCAASGEHDGPVQGREQSIRSAEEEEGDAAARARERRTADAALQRAIAVGMLAGVRFALSRATATGVDDARLEAARTFLATAAAAAVKVAAAQPDAPDATTGAEPGSEIVEATAAPEPPPIENWLHHLDALGAAEDDEADSDYGDEKANQEQELHEKEGEPLVHDGADDEEDEEEMEEKEPEAIEKDVSFDVREAPTPEATPVGSVTPLRLARTPLEEQRSDQRVLSVRSEVGAMIEPGAAGGVPALVSLFETGTGVGLANPLETVASVAARPPAKLGMSHAASLRSKRAALQKEAADKAAEAMHARAEAEKPTEDSPPAELDEEDEDEEDEGEEDEGEEHGVELELEPVVIADDDDDDDDDDVDEEDDARVSPHSAAPRAVAMQHARLPKWGIARMSSFGGSLSSHSVLSPMSLVAQARARVARARQAKGSSPFSPQSADMLSPDMLENKPPLDSPRAPELSI